MAVAPWIVSDALWDRIGPLLPKVERRFRFPGRKRLPDREALQGIVECGRELPVAVADQDPIVVPLLGQGHRQVARPALPDERALLLARPPRGQRFIVLTT
jgi:hypothetical protein